jgi:hypothetical protein
MPPVYTATTAMAMSGFFCLGRVSVEWEHLFYGPVRLPLRLDTRRRRNGDGKWKLSSIFFDTTDRYVRYVGIWMGIRQLGPLVGGAISLALNVNTAHVGKVTYTTYLGLVAISSLGAPFALLLSQPQDVIRSNGTKIPYMKKTTFGIELRAIWRQLRNKYMLLLIPVFLAGQFGTTYQGNYLTCTASNVLLLDDIADRN